MTEKSKYVRFDWAIKRILRDKTNKRWSSESQPSLLEDGRVATEFDKVKEVLEGLITVLLGEPVTIMEILESEGNQDSREDKMNRVDVKAKTSEGEYIIVEVQLTKERDFFQRILFGTAKGITDQISIGQDYSVIKKIYSINILYFDFGCGDDYAYHGVTTFTGMTKEGSVLRFNNEKEERYISETTKHVTLPDEVFPEYFLLIVNHFKRWSSESHPSLLEDGRVVTEFDEVNEVAKTPIEEWMDYLKDAVIRDDTTTPGLQAAREKLAYMSMTDKERRAYEDYMISVHAAKDAWDTAIDEAKAEGMERGMVTANRENAQKMKALGLSSDVIAQVTGLTAEEIEGL